MMATTSPRLTTRLAALLALVALLLSWSGTARAAVCLPRADAPAAEAHAAHGGAAGPSATDEGAPHSPAGHGCPEGTGSMATCTASVPVPATAVLLPIMFEGDAAAPPAPVEHARFLPADDLFDPPRR